MIRLDEPVPAEIAASPVVLLHGFLGEPADWDAVAADLDVPREVWRVDLLERGSESSSPDRYDLAGRAAVVAEALERNGLAPATIVGYSLGARVTMALLATRPELVRIAVAVSGTPGIEDEDERQARAEADDALAYALEREGIGNFLERWYDQPLFASLRTHPDYGLIARRRLTGDGRAWARVLREASPGRNPSLWRRLPQFVGRLRLAVGGLDGKYLDLARRVQEIEPRIPITVVEGAGHAIHLERPEALASMIDRLP